ncbi:MAG: efflux RND transporter permease subunit [Bacteroidales bacterium]|nr:efflux RND transporter permease subunit [Bacteroidales bacterium]
MMKRGEAEVVRGAIAHKNIVYLILVMLILTGIVGLTFMNKDEFPSFELKQGLVAGIYPGADAKEVEVQLTRPLEDLLFSMSEVDREQTYSYSKDGICYIYVELTVPAKKKDEAWSKIKLKIDSYRQMLPSGVLAVAVLDDFSAVSSMLIALESSDKSYAEMKEYADILSDRLKTIPALAGVSVVGTQQEEIAVTVDMDRLSAYGISPFSLTSMFMTSGMQVMSGEYSTSYVTSPIHVESMIDAEKEIADKIVYSDPSGNIVRLSDVASVERRYKEPASYVDYNGHTALVLSVVMRLDNNIVAFGEDVDRILEEFEDELPDSVKVSRITDQPKVVSTSVTSFLRDLVISMLVVIFVMLMLFPMRSALIASSGVPVCTAVTLAIMFLTGIDLNTVTLAALIVVLGMIVDDSIITMDGYMDKLGKGMSRIDAATASAKELFMPMFMATFAISAMFFPIKGIITGYLGDFVKLFPWVIAIALGISLAYAMLVVPSMEVKFIRSTKTSSKGFTAKLQNALFNGLQSGYDRMQAVCFRHPKLTILAGVAAVGLGVLMFLQLNIQMMPMAARKYFAIEIYLDENSSLEHTKSGCDSLYSLLAADDRVESVTSFIGTGAPRFTATYAPITPSRNRAQMIVNTSSVKDTEDMLREYERKYGHSFPKAVVRFKQMDYQAVQSQIAVTLKGASQEEMIPLADSIKAFMQGMDDDLKWVHSDCDDYVTSVNVVIDEEEAARLGVNKAMLSVALSGAFNGQTITSIYEGADKVPVTLYSGAVGKDMCYEALSDYLVGTGVPGVYVPLRQVASIEPEWHPASITRTSGEESVTVSADMKSGKSQPVVMSRIDAYIKDVVEPSLPEGVTVSYGGLASVNDNVIPEILLSFICAVLVLFFFMVFHFKKISLAILTLVLSLLCLFGASFGLWVFGLDFGLTSVLGLISLVGIIVRNGIIMFEYAEELRFVKGYDVKTAAEEAGKRRMRPIFLTSCTTALGVLPMIVSHDSLWLPMGVVICFGTVLSIVLIVLIMPVSYWQIFRKSGNAPAAVGE